MTGTTYILVIYRLFFGISVLQFGTFGVEPHLVGENIHEIHHWSQWVVSTRKASALLKA